MTQPDTLHTRLRAEIDRAHARPAVTDILSRIDDTLTYHSAGLGVDLEVAAEKPAPELPPDLAAFAAAFADWQRRFVEDVGRMLHAFAEPFGRVLNDIAPKLQTFMAAVEKVEREAEVARRARLRRMHHLYWRRRVR